MRIETIAVANFSRHCPWDDGNSTTKTKGSPAPWSKGWNTTRTHPPLRHPVQRVSKSFSRHTNLRGYVVRIGPTRYLIRTANNVHRFTTQETRHIARPPPPMDPPFILSPLKTHTDVIMAVPQLKIACHLIKYVPMHQCVCARVNSSRLYTRIHAPINFNISNQSTVYTHMHYVDINFAEDIYFVEKASLFIILYNKVEIVYVRKGKAASSLSRIFAILITTGGFWTVSLIMRFNYAINRSCLVSD